MPKKKQPPRLLTTAETASRLGVSVRALQRYRENEWITGEPGPRDGRRVLYRESEVSRFLAEERSA